MLLKLDKVVKSSSSNKKIVSLEREVMRRIDLTLARLLKDKLLGN